MVEEQFITFVAKQNIDTPFDQAGSQTPTKQKLPAVLSTKDMTIFLLLIILFISNVNGVQFGGIASSPVSSPAQKEKEEKEVVYGF